MKRLYKNIILFLLPVIVLVLILPVDKRMKFQGLHYDCFNHGIWIYDRIFNNSKPVDIAILGSSHTINGMDDKLIENEMQETDFKVVNFGYCRLGRNFSFALLKEIIEEKRPKYLILEVLEDEDWFSHPIYPYIARSEDVVLVNPLINRNYLKDLYTHCAYKTELTQEFLYQKTETDTIRQHEFGFSSSADTISSDILDEIKIQRSIKRPEQSGIERSYFMSMPRKYLKKIHKLCEKNNMKILFLYLPSYGVRYKKPKEYTAYQKYGEVIIPPEYIMDNKNNWYDENHLNVSGANKLSFWLANELNHILK